ncbi:hypothetical protein TNCV_1347161 [Trichonephila clavipes]|nr:hypothetical protein TNCV_1347161 [Trichonephila clavipes]
MEVRVGCQLRCRPRPGFKITRSVANGPRAALWCDFNITLTGCSTSEWVLSRIHTKAVSVERLANQRLHLRRNEVSDWLDAQLRLPCCECSLSVALLRNRYGRGSRVLKVSDREWPCHKFEPSTTKDLPCRAAMHVKSVES